MPRPRVKTRIEHLADAHGRLLQTHAALREVDLRTTRGELRAAIRGARDANSAALSFIEAAIKADMPN